MINVSIIGSGNVAQHLITAFAKSKNIQLIQVYSRKEQPALLLPDSVVMIHDLNDLSEADLYIIAVSDNAIAEVSAQLPFKNRLVVHTSGSAALDALNDSNRKGVFYPLQTFTKNKEVDFTAIPFCLETQNETDYTIVEQAAKAISDKVFSINSLQRKSLHVAAVFVNNFTNHLYGIGNAICNEHNVPFEVLKPLIKETAEKVMQLSPNEAQTGPAKRNDTTTIEAHLAFLSDENQKNIYTILTQSIQDNVKKL